MSIHSTQSFAAAAAAAAVHRYRCMGLGYMWIRFGNPYDGVTATPSGLKRPVYVQSTWMRARVAPYSYAVPVRCGSGRGGHTLQVSGISAVSGK
jgi:hypothetical protein